MRDLLLRGARLIRASGLVEGPKDILISLGRIVRVSPDIDAVSADWDEIDCAGCYVSPGLVNLHTHSPMSLFRGLAEDVSIEDWFNVRIWPYESNLEPWMVRAGASLAIAEMLDSGVTAFADHYFMSEEVAAAAKMAGIRADIAPTVFGLSPSWREDLAESVSLIRETNCTSGRFGDLVRMRLGPHAPYTCPQEVLEAFARAAEETGVGLHIHVSETKRQVEESLMHYGKTPFERLHDAGLIRFSNIYAHSTWMTPGEVSLLKEGGPSYVAVAPKTYAKLASGAGQMYEMMEMAGRAGLSVGIGTDGVASSNTASPLEQARLLALWGKEVKGDSTQFPLTSVWQLLMAGHAAIGAGTGDIQEGRAADLVVWDLRKLHTYPVHDPLAAIIYSADGRNVRDVIVSGRVLKRDGRLVSVDSDLLMKEAGAAVGRLIEKGAGRAKVKY